MRSYPLESGRLGKLRVYAVWFPLKPRHILSERRALFAWGSLLLPASAIANQFVTLAKSVANNLAAEVLIATTMDYGWHPDNESDIRAF